MDTCKKECISLSSRIVHSKIDKLSVWYKDDRCQNFLNLERRNITECILFAKWEREAM